MSEVTRGERRAPGRGETVPRAPRRQLPSVGLSSAVAVALRRPNKNTRIHSTIFINGIVTGSLSVISLIILRVQI